jgi:LPXTG-site transpeptidase (sortase) family protein
MKAVFAKRLLLVAVGTAGLLFTASLSAAGSVFEGSILFGFNQSQSTHPASASPLDKQVPVSRELPMRLKIPSIKVNAAIQYVGLTRAGAMDVPKGRSDVAWFKLGPRPGETGSAVIAGHVARSGSAVFNNLSKLRAGDVLYIQDGRAKTISFVVRSSHIYNSNSLAPEVFGSASGSHLNLVTCAGAWDKSKNGFTKRLVVFADVKN